MIYYFQPSCINKDLGSAYNQYMELIQPDDWAVMMDRDIMFLRPDYHQSIINAIEAFPDTGTFTCYTNRVGNLEQCYKGEQSLESDILKHRIIADEVYEQNKGKVKDLKMQHISGFLMIFQKSTWEAAGKFEKGIFCDHPFTHNVNHKAKKQIRLIEELYVFHYYRLKEGARYTEHLR